MPLVRAKPTWKKWGDAIGSLGEQAAVFAGIRWLRRGFWPGRMWRRYRGSPWLGLRAVLGQGGRRRGRAVAQLGGDRRELALCRKGRCGLNYTRAKRIGCARQGTEVVGRLWGRSPEHVSRQLPWCAGGRARRRAWRARVGRSATALIRWATSCFGARRWTAPWYRASGRRVRKDNWRSDGPARRLPWPVRRGASPGAWREGGRTPSRLGARAPRQRDGLGKARPARTTSRHRLAEIVLLCPCLNT
jgi:hypothetical protein